MREGQDQAILTYSVGPVHMKKETDAWRGTGPRPTGKESDLGTDRDRPSPYGHHLVGALFNRVYPASRTGGD